MPTERSRAERPRTHSIPCLSPSSPCGDLRSRLGGDLLSPFGSLQFADERDDPLAEEFDLFLEMQEAEEDQAGAGGLEGEDALGDLLGCADQVRLEAVIVLDEVLEGG